MLSALLIVASAGLFQGAAAETIQLSSKLSSDSECKHQFKTVPQGPIELGECQFGDGAHVMYTCVNNTKLHLLLNLGGSDCTKGLFTYEADLTNGECSPLKPLGFASGIWSWTGGCGAKAAVAADDVTPKPTAAELRRWAGSTNCSGEHTVVNTDQMDTCTPYLVPKPSSIKTAQLNETAYSTYHFAGVQDCSGAPEKVGDDRIVGTCENLGDYSQMRVWTSSPDPSSASCAAPGDCGLAYKACCAGSKLKGSPCNCHLHNGTGTAGSVDCGFCGKAYVGCCTAFGLAGHACTCDIKDNTASSIVV